MAIAFDNATYQTTLTTSYTCSGTNRILFVSINGDTSDDVTGVTYNSVSMTLLDKLQVTGDRYQYLFMLVNPASGANNIVISGPAGAVQNFAFSYTGAKQSAQPDAHGSFGASGVTSIAKTLTTTANNCWMVCHASFIGNGATLSITGGSVRASSNDLGVGDGNGAVASGSNTITATQNGSAQNAVILAASIAPVVATPNSNFFMFGI